MKEETAIKLEMQLETIRIIGKLLDIPEFNALIREKLREAKVKKE